MAADATRQLTDVEEVASDLRDITAAIGEIGERSSAVSSHQVDLSASTERASRALSRFHTGGTIDRLQKLCRGLGDELREILEQAVDGRRVTLDKLLALDYRELKGSQIHALQSLFDSAASRAVALTHRSSRRPTTGSSTPR
jgi:methyl-accepting chemotaxis protein